MAVKDGVGQGELMEACMQRLRAMVASSAKPVSFLSCMVTCRNAVLSVSLYPKQLETLITSSLAHGGATPSAAPSAPVCSNMKDASKRTAGGAPIIRSPRSNMMSCDPAKLHEIEIMQFC
jgi:hypothetical protein